MGGAVAVAVEEEEASIRTRRGTRGGGEGGGEEVACWVLRGVGAWKKDRVPVQLQARRSKANVRLILVVDEGSIGGRVGGRVLLLLLMLLQKILASQLQKDEVYAGPSPRQRQPCGVDE